MQHLAPRDASLTHSLTHRLCLNSVPLTTLTTGRRNFTEEPRLEFKELDSLFPEPLPSTPEHTVCDFGGC